MSQVHLKPQPQQYVRMSQVNPKPSLQQTLSGQNLSGLTHEQKTQLIFARMYVLHGFDTSRTQSAQMQPAQMQATRIQPDQMQPAHMQAGQLYGSSNVPSSQSTTNANSSPNPLSPGPKKPADKVALRKKVDHESQFGWKFDPREWSKNPDPSQKNLYGFSREEYLFLKEQKLVRTDPFYMQWEIDRQEESDQLKALRPWYCNEGTEDSDLVLMSDAVLSKELEAFYGDMEKDKISNVTIPSQECNDHNNAAGVTSNLSRTNGKTELNNFVDEADVGNDASELLSKFLMKAGPGGRLVPGVCKDE